MDIIYSIGSGSTWDNNELRYSLRSLDMYGKSYDRVFVVGNIPEFLSDEVIKVPYGVTGTYVSLMAQASGNNIIGSSTTIVNGVTSTGAYSGTLNITSSGLVSITYNSNSYDFGTAPMTITFEGSMSSGGGSN